MVLHLAVVATRFADEFLPAKATTAENKERKDVKIVAEG